MYSNVDLEEEEGFSIAKSLSAFWLTEYHIVAPYDVTILMIGCISMMSGLCLTIFTLVMSRREEEEQNMDMYNSIIWGPVLILLGCLMFLAAALLCGLQTKKNSDKQKVGFMELEEIEKIKEGVGFINKEGWSGGLAVVY